MLTDSRTKLDKTLTQIKIKNNQIIFRSSKNSTSTNLRKRSQPTSLTTPILQNVFTKKPKLYNNRYNVLANLDDNVETNDVHKSSSQEPTDTTAYTFVKEILSPPIFIKGVKNVTEIFIEFTNLIGRNSFV